ncbi:MAG: hypothetical protein ACTSR7_03530 [Promethearchaeota archaeon]
MTKKGKFKLSSFLVEDFLIYYRSINKNHKLNAFAVALVSDFQDILPYLIQMLRKRYINYFSVQINVVEKREDLIIINLYNDKKDGIIRSFHILYEYLNKKGKIKCFYKNEMLKNIFLGLLTVDLNSHTKLIRASNSLLIKNQNEMKVFKLYELDFKSENRSILVTNFINYLIDSELGGYFLLNVQFDEHDNIITRNLYINVSEKIQEDGTIIEEKINDFFDQELLKNIKININDVFSILWRKPLSNKQLFTKLPDWGIQSDEKLNLREIVNEIEYSLKEKNINFQKINPFLLFIEQNIVFLIAKEADINHISKILNKYYSKYKIIILIIEEEEYEKLYKIEKISQLKDLKIMDISTFSQFNYSTLKN